MVMVLLGVVKILLVIVFIDIVVVWGGVSSVVKELMFRFFRFEKIVVLLVIWLSLRVFLCVVLMDL